MAATVRQGVRIGAAEGVDRIEHAAETRLFSGLECPGDAKHDDRVVAVPQAEELRNEFMRTDSAMHEAGDEFRVGFVVGRLEVFHAIV